MDQETKELIIETGGKALIAGLVAGTAVLAGSGGDYGASTWAAVAVAAGRAAVLWLAGRYEVEVQTDGTHGSDRLDSFAGFARKYL